MKGWTVEEWMDWFNAQRQPLARNDFVYLRHLAVNWNTAGELLCFARSHTLMSSWPPEIEPSQEELRRRALAFRKLKIRFAHMRNRPLMLNLHTWSGETKDGWNARALIASLRRHHAAELTKQTEKIKLQSEFYLFAIAAVLLLSNIATVVFGVGLAAKAAVILLAYFEQYVQLQKLNHAALEADEDRLRRTLSEAMALQEELSLLFSEMETLQRNLERDAEMNAS